MKTFTKKVRNMVFEVVKNNDYKGYNQLCEKADNASVKSCLSVVESARYHDRKCSSVLFSEKIFTRFERAFSLFTKTDVVASVKIF